jgi:hypothetical protein
MNYTRPEITSLASASRVIQTAVAKTQSNTDSGGSGFETPTAYVADE